MRGRNLQSKMEWGGRVGNDQLTSWNDFLPKELMNAILELNVIALLYGLTLEEIHIGGWEGEMMTINSHHGGTRVVGVPKERKNDI